MELAESLTYVHSKKVSNQGHQTREPDTQVSYGSDDCKFWLSKHTSFSKRSRMYGNDKQIRTTHVTVIVFFFPPYFSQYFSVIYFAYSLLRRLPISMIIYGCICHTPLPFSAHVNHRQNMPRHITLVGQIVLVTLSANKNLNKNYPWQVSSSPNRLRTPCTTAQSFVHGVTYCSGMGSIPTSGQPLLHFPHFPVTLLLLHQIKAQKPIK